MRRIESYLFRQFLKPTAVATAALGGVAMLSSILTNLDLIVDNRQTAWVFLKIVMLGVPQLLVIVLPIAVLVAALATVNRLHSEQEIVVCFAGGMSRWQVMSPAFRLATFAALLMLVVNLWASPACYRAVRQEFFKIRTDLAASLVREGAFTQPAMGLTVYTQSVDQQGQLRNLFIEQRRNGGDTTTFSAKTGVITKKGSQPVLIMRNGSNQQYNSSGVLNYLAFDEYTFDLTPYLNVTMAMQYKRSDLYIHELLFPGPELKADKKERRKMLAEANSRLATPLYVFTFVSLALWAVIGGPFSRTGYGGRIAYAAAYATVIRIGGAGVQFASEGAAVLNLLQYAVPLVPMFIALRRLLWPRLIQDLRQSTTDLIPMTSGARA